MKQMTVNILNIELLNSECILATDLYYYDSNILLYRKGTILTEERINKLKKFGILSIPVYIFEDTTIEQSNDIVRKKLELDYEQIYEYANYIIETVASRKDIRDMITRTDGGLYAHSHKVALLSTMIGMNMENLSNDDLEELAVSSLLHDIGKSTIDFSILNKPSSLTADEYEIIKQHSQNGYDILTATGMFSQDICDAVLSHHENEDGSGYPYNRKSNDIPLYSKIIHICDVYSALTTKRCYKDAWSIEETFKLFDKDKEKFEPKLLEILKTSLPIYVKDDLVHLSTNELATVIETYDYGILVKVLGDKRTIRINCDNHGPVYVKKKIATN